LLKSTILTKYYVGLTEQAETSDQEKQNAALINLAEG
jgi:hypothetical protein